MIKKQSSNNITGLAMYYGTVMGLFWILKFTLVPLMFSNTFAPLLFILLTLLVPFFGYYLMRQYRNKYCADRQISFSQACVFGFLMYVFAALLTAIAHYIYFRYLERGELFDAYTQMLEITKTANPGLAESFKASEEALNIIRQMTPIKLTVQLISNNIFYGTFFTLPSALILSLTGRRKENENKL